VCIPVEKKTRFVSLFSFLSVAMEKIGYYCILFLCIASVKIYSHMGASERYKNEHERKKYQREKGRHQSQKEISTHVIALIIFFFLPHYIRCFFSFSPCLQRPSPIFSFLHRHSHLVFFHSFSLPLCVFFSRGSQCSYFSFSPL
jgi:hypothetical protein